MFGQALEGRLAAVIACAGGVQVSSHGPPEDTVPFAYYGITGDADFNYQEMMALEQHLHQVGSAHRFEVFEGRHGWAPHDLAEIGWNLRRTLGRNLHILHILRTHRRCYP